MTLEPFVRTSPPKLITAGVGHEPEDRPSTDGSIGQQPMAAARIENPWWNLGYTDGRLEADKMHALEVLAAEVQADYDAEATRRQEQLRTAEAALQGAKTSQLRIEERVAEAIGRRKALTGVAWEPVHHQTGVACIWFFFALVAFLADLGLAENVVRNGFNVAPRPGKDLLLWVIYFGMIAGIMVFGGIVKLVVSEIGALVPGWRRHVDLGFWVIVMVFTFWSLYALSMYRGSSETADGNIFTADLNRQRKDALLAFCIALPVIAAAFFRKAAYIFTVHQEDKALFARLNTWRGNTAVPSRIPRVAEAQ